MVDQTNGAIVVGARKQRTASKVPSRHDGRVVVVVVVLGLLAGVVAGRVVALQGFAS